jgi:hypothetical protein
MDLGRPAASPTEQRATAMERKQSPGQNWAELASQGWTMVAGEEAGTALRVRIDTCERGGCVHLEQMAYSPTVGWYRQKMFSLPRSMAGELSRLLRMGECLLPAGGAGVESKACSDCDSEHAGSLPFALAGQGQGEPGKPEPSRRSG